MIPYMQICVTGRGGRLGRAQASHAESRKFRIWPYKINDVPNLYMSLPSLMLYITRLGQVLVSSG